MQVLRRPRARRLPAACAPAPTMRTWRRASPLGLQVLPGLQVLKSSFSRVFRGCRSLCRSGSTFVSCKVAHPVQVYQLVKVSPRVVDILCCGLRHHTHTQRQQEQGEAYDMGAQVLDLGGASDSDSGSSGLGAAVDQRWGGRAGRHCTASARPGAARALPASLLPGDADAWLFSSAPAAALPPPLQGAGCQNPDLQGGAGLALGAQNSPEAEPGSAEPPIGSSLCKGGDPSTTPGGSMFANTLPPPACDNTAAPPPTAVFGNALPQLANDSAAELPAAAMFANALLPPAWDNAAAAPGVALFANALPPIAGPQGVAPSPHSSFTRPGDCLMANPNQAGAGAAGSKASVDTVSVHSTPAEALLGAAGNGERGEAGASRVGDAAPGPKTLRGARRGLRFDDPAPPAFVLPGGLSRASGCGTSPASPAAAAAQQGGAECAEAPPPGGGSPGSAAGAHAEGDARSPHTPGGVPGKESDAAGPVRTPAPVRFTPARSLARHGEDPDPTIEEQMSPGSQGSWGMRPGFLGSQGLPICSPAIPSAGPELDSGSETPAAMGAATPPLASSPWSGPAGLAGALRGSPSAGIARRWLQAAGAAGTYDPAAGTSNTFPGGRLRDAAPSARPEPYRPTALAAIWGCAVPLPHP